MGYERNPRGNEPRGYQGRDDDYGRNGGTRDDRFSGARDGSRTDEQRGYGAPRQDGWGDRDDGRGQQRYAGGGQDHGSRDYARDPYRQARGTYDRQPQDYRDDDRGFFDRAGDEVRSWFGDEDAERRRERDARSDEQGAGRPADRDEHYHSWRNQQIAAFDRDYDEYRQENQSKFHNEFSSWRTGRQGQRDLLDKVEEHADVVGSDGEHVGTVDKVRGDRIVLTRNDADAGGRHHSVPLSWLQSVESGKVTLRKTAAEAKAHWRDEERSGGALFGRDGEKRHSGEGRSSDGATNLNRSFSGTY